MNTDLTQLLTIDEICEALRIHPRTLARLRKSGNFIEPIRFGQSIRFDPDDLAAWIMGQKS